MLVVFIVSTTGTALVATGDIRNIKFPYCTHCHKSYYTKEKCWILYLHLKQQVKAEKGRRGPSDKKRKTYKMITSQTTLWALLHTLK